MYEIVVHYLFTEDRVDTNYFVSHLNEMESRKKRRIKYNNLVKIICNSSVTFTRNTRVRVYVKRKSERVSFT